MDTQSWVEEKLESGYDRNTIRNVLKKKGYEESEINELLKTPNKSQKYILREYSRYLEKIRENLDLERKSLTYTAAGILGVIAIIGIYAYYPGTGQSCSINYNVEEFGEVNGTWQITINPEIEGRDSVEHWFSFTKAEGYDDVVSVHRRDIRNFELEDGERKTIQAPDIAHGFRAGFDPRNCDEYTELYAENY